MKINTDKLKILLLTILYIAIPLLIFYGFVFFTALVIKLAFK